MRSILFGMIVISNVNRTVHIFVFLPLSLLPPPSFAHASTQINYYHQSELLHAYLRNYLCGIHIKKGGEYLYWLYRIVHSQ